ncbi:SRPBCC family protein [Streptomyces niveus]|uniref:SRPBCC family protein n=1 Tax=Streptomyces niveus TaxID=193462 RepID=UPI0036B55AC1
MEHEVFIPVPAETLREALRDHARVARCVPGLQQDADASARPLSGRLKVRVGGHTITYRGALTLTERAGAFTAKGEGAEVRGTGATKVSVRISLTETPGGTTVAFTTTSTPTSEGRLSDVTPSTAETTARRLLDRFAAALAKPGAGAGDGSGSTPTSGESTASGAEAGRDAVRADGRPDDAAAAHAAGSGDADRAAGRDSGASDGDGQDVPPVGAPDGRGTAASDDASGAGPQASGASGGGDGRDVASADESSAGAGAGPGRDGADAAHAAEADDRSGGAADAPSSGDAPDVASADQSSAGAGGGPDAPRAHGPEGRGAASGRAGDASGATPEFDGLELPDDPDSDLDASAGFGATASGDGDFLVPLEPPAEAAHARRTMIGRSAEEVDHAPPRGRYAPEQGPDSGGAGVALRWVAPAAALAIAGAVVVGRALRRRR